VLTPATPHAGTFVGAAFVPSSVMDWRLYRERNRIERLVNRLKQYRRVATRYDKLADSYSAFVTLAAIRMWL